MHTMQVVSVSPDGKSTEFHCPDCGRRIRITWPPNYSRTVLVAGAEDELHAGCLGGVTMQAQVQLEDPRLDVWADYMRNRKL